MKRFLLTILISLTAFSAFAQEPEASVNERYFEAKIREFVYQLRLTDEQKAQFVPLYKRYNDEMRASLGEPERPDAPPATAEDAAAWEKKRIKNQQAALDIRLKYVDEFAAVLEPNQLLRLFRIEGQILQKQMNRKGKYGHGPCQGPGQGKGPGHNGKAPGKPSTNNQ
ncbi:MAG: Spy/CpxP family protein refolding chaperone [Bacteroidales bacterium]|nr:Spy/CpxP family protein refolding chaperone [Bacteroidales bacterium]